MHQVRAARAMRAARASNTACAAQLFFFIQPIIFWICGFVASVAVVDFQSP